MWTKKRLLKDVYLLKENQAVKNKYKYRTKLVIKFFVYKVKYNCILHYGSKQSSLGKVKKANRISY